jgi:ATP-dependent helicase HepA
MSFVSVVEGKYAGLGIARLLRTSRGIATIEFFAGPEVDTQPRFDVPLTSIRKTHIPKETRVFFPTHGGTYWKVGRCLDGSDEPIQVQFPNRETVNIPSSELYVRWRKPIANPAAYLARMVTETPMFAFNRAGFMRSIIQQRATALGVTAALSSMIELQPHQLEVARRVLHDPNQRYLLADEVGLGKTIEACIVLRQYFIDEPYSASALVIVPNAIVNQWTEELRTRFSLADYLGSALQVVSADSIETIEAIIADVGLIIVDEAHHLTQDTPECRHLYELVESVSTKVPRLLLLSATPVLGNEGAFLRMLHLLDPSTYAIADLPAFKRRIESRQQVAEAVAGLTPQNAMILDSYFDELLARFTDDPILRSSIESLRTVLSRFPEDNDEEFLQLLGRLRSHISDTYRLDRRILRNRRANVKFLTPTRRPVRVWAYHDSNVTTVAHSVDAIRRILETFEGSGNEGGKGADIAQNLISSWAVGPESVLAWAAALPESLKSLLSADLEAISIAATEIRKIKLREERLYRQLKDLVASKDVKVVIFSCLETTADSLYAFLRSRMSSAIERHGRHGIRGDDGWRRFLTTKTCKVLVCDERAEEGLNLQGGAKVIVHYDLPFSANRVEQRIGRVDRFGSGNSIESFVVICDDDPFATEWFRCLANGFSVFSASIASLQYLVDEVMTQLRSDIVEQGPVAIDATIELLAGPSGKVQTERRKIASQDALDALSDDKKSSWDSMMDLDVQWKDLRSSVDPWIRESLIFGIEKVPVEATLPAGDQIVRYRFENDARRSTLVSAMEFAARFAGTMDRKALGYLADRPLTHPYSYRRSTALSAEGRANGTRLLRSGDVFLNGLEEFTNNDDRGRSYAMWRRIAGYEAAASTGVDVFFAVHLIIEADLQPAIEASGRGSDGEISTRMALRRRVEAAFPPISYTTWISSDLTVAESTFSRQYLLQPYDKVNNGLGGEDRNIRTDRWDALRDLGIPEINIWSELPQRVAELGRKAALLDDGVVNTIHTADSGLREGWISRAQHFQLRRERLDERQRLAEDAVANWERGVSLALIRGVSSPKVKLDSIGAIFLSATNLPDTKTR